MKRANTHHYIRKALPTDRKRYFIWANDPAVREASFTSREIAWEEHKAWYDSFMERCAAGQADAFVLMDFFMGLGQLRVEPAADDPRTGVLSYSIAKELRGRGCASELLTLAEDKLRDKYDTLRAEVKRENAASRALLEHLSYKALPSPDAERLLYEKRIDAKQTESTAPDAVSHSETASDLASGTDTASPLGEKEITAPVNTLTPGEASYSETVSVSSERGRICNEPGDESGTGASTARDPRFETLRVVAMLMVIGLHYLQSLLSPLSGGGAAAAGFYTLEALCLVSVNVYVMISGYFAVDAQFRLRKFIRLWAETFFYSVVIALICFATGIEPFGAHKNLYELQYLIFPVSNGHYWFVTTYLMLYLLSPLLGAGMRKISKTQYQFVLVCLLIFTCGLKSVFLEHMPGLEDHGCGMLWFVTLYLLAGYIRLYGLSFAKTKLSALLWYIFAAAGTLACVILGEKLDAGLVLGDKLTLTLKDAQYLADDYNHAFVLLGSIAFFMLFANMKKKAGGILSLAGRLAPYSLGVYLIHDHIYLQGKWQELMQVGGSYGIFRIMHFIGTLALVFLVCAAIDALRELIFSLAEKLLDLICKIYYAKKELWDYLIAGFAATVVSWLTYYIFAMMVLAWMSNEAVRVLLGNAVSWTITVVFAYVINRVFVFHSETKGFAAVGKEFLEFVAARLFSFGLEELIMFVFVSLLGWNEILVKVLIASIVVIVINYILSKLWIFKKPAKESADEGA